MKKQLTLALRPKRFSQLLGQEGPVRTVRGVVGSKRKTNAWMFVGETGTGKTTMARIMAVSLNCTHQKVFGEPCDACLVSDWPIHEVNASNVTGVDEIRSFASGAGYVPPANARMKIYILDEAQWLSKQSQNLLLKEFEEAPISTTWIVCTTDPVKIIPALTGRCQVVELRPLEMKAMEVLVARGLKALGSDKSPKPLIEAMWQEEVRRPRAILAAVQAYAGGASAAIAVEPVSAGISSKTVGLSLLKGNWNTVKHELAKATAEDLRALRAKVTGYLRGALLSEIQGPRAKWISEAIEKLAWVDSCTDVSQGPATVAAMYYLCAKFAGETLEDDPQGKGW
jgi:DNA polymerase-3 subunit gamma/tau